MKKLEQLLNIDLGKKFDTRKNLNRSTKEIPSNIVEQLEQREFTTEMLEELQKEIPIYRYRSCITIHGTWPKVVVNRIGHYKNVTQNKNGSVEIRYSAIDRGKLKTVETLLSGCGSKIWLVENSNTRLFRFTKVVNAENYTEAKELFSEIAKRVSKVNVYGFISLYLMPLPFSSEKQMCLDINILAMHSGQEKSLVLALTGYSEEKFNTETEIEGKRKQKEDQEYAESRLKDKQEFEEKRTRENALIKELSVQIEHLKECNNVSLGVLVRVQKLYGSFLTGTKDRVIFSYMKVDGKGSFNRMKWSKAESENFISNVNDLVWVEQKQQKLEEFSAIGYKLIK